MTIPCLAALAITVLVAALRDLYWRRRERRRVANDGLRRWVEQRAREVL